MKWISYRGNRFGREPEKEGTPEWVSLSIHEGFDVMIDVWYDATWKTGANDTKHDMDTNWLENEKIWFYPRDKATLEKLQALHHARVYHENDPDWCWCPEKMDKYNNQSPFVCSNYIGWYKQRAEAKKRVAVFIGGRLTCQDTCLLPQIRNYLHKHPEHWIDVFISINNDPDSLDSYKNLPQMDAPFIAAISCEKTVCKNEYLNYHHRAGETNVPTCISMFYHNYLAMKLLTQHKEQNSIFYDLVIKYRPDIIEQDNELPIVVSPFKELLLDTPSPEEGSFNKACVYMPNTNDTTYKNIPKANDQIGVGSYEVMLLYANIYPKMTQYLDHNDFGYYLHPETMLGFHLQEMGIETRRFTYPYSLHLSRRN